MIEKAKTSPTFCIYPFSHLATKTDGTFKLCCRSEPIGHIKSQSLHEIWNGENIKRVRRQLLNGERPPECETCWHMEDVGARSMRQRALKNGGDQSRWNLFSKQLLTCSDDGSMTGVPKSLELKISNLCNLKCRMCHPVDSTMWAKDWPTVSDMMKIHDPGTFRAAERHNIIAHPVLAEFVDNEKWWADFEDIIDELEIIEFAGGEPLIDPVHYKILDKIERCAPNIHLKYSTNLTRLNYRGRQVTDLWKNYASVEVYASVDGIYDVYEYIRTGAKFEDTDENISIIANSNNFHLEELAIACTVQIYNAFQIIDIAEYFLKRKIKFHTHHVTFPNFLNVQVLPRTVKEILSENVLHWMKREPLNEYEEDSLPKVKAHMQDFLNFMNGKDDSYLLPAFCEFTRRMDLIRETNASSLSPILAKVLSSNAQPYHPETFCEK